MFTAATQFIEHRSPEIGVGQYFDEMPGRGLRSTHLYRHDGD